MDAAGSFANFDQAKAEECEKIAVSLDDFHAYMPMHNYIHAPSRTPWPGASVNARLPAVTLTDANGTPVLDGKGKPKTILPATWLDKNRAIEQMTWAPGLPEIIRDKTHSRGRLDRP